MGKVLKSFTPGYPGSVSRNSPNVIASFRNGNAAQIAYGSPLFLRPAVKGVMNYVEGMVDAANFVGFAVRIPDDTPDTFNTTRSCYVAGDPVEVLMWGSIVVQVSSSSAKIGDPVYLRLADGKLVTNAGAAGETIPLEGVVIRGPMDINGYLEVSVTRRRL